MISSKYNDIAPLYDILDKPFEYLFYRKMRKHLLSDIRERKILDLGTGTGKNLPYFHSSNRIMAIDLSKNMLKQAKIRYRKLDNKPNVDFRLADNPFSIPVEDNQFDFVVATFVIYLNSNPRDIIEEIQRVLLPDGKLLLAEYKRPRKLYSSDFVYFLNKLTIPVYNLDFLKINTLQICSQLFDEIKIFELFGGWLYTAEIS